MLLPVDGQASWCIYHFLDLIEHCFRRRAVGSHLLFVLDRRSTALTRKKKLSAMIRDTKFTTGNAITTLD